MDDRNTRCRKQREILLERFLSDGEKAHLPSELNSHLQNCAHCARYWGNLGAVRSTYAPDRLYSPFLRAKALRRIAERDQAFKFGWMPLIVLAAFLSVAFSFVIPVWLLATLFMYWTSSTAIAFGVALASLLAGGIIVTVVSTISLMERGYIHFGDEKWIPIRTEAPSTAGIH